MVAVLTGVKWHLVVGLTRVCLMVSDADKLFTWLRLCYRFGQVSTPVLCPFFNCIVCLCGIAFYKVFIHFGYQPL